MPGAPAPPCVDLLALRHPEFAAVPGPVTPPEHRSLHFQKCDQALPRQERQRPRRPYAGTRRPQRTLAGLLTCRSEEGLWVSEHKAGFLWAHQAADRWPVARISYVSKRRTEVGRSPLKRGPGHSQAHDSVSGPTPSGPGLGCVQELGALASWLGAPRAQESRLQGCVPGLTIGRPAARLVAGRLQTAKPLTPFLSPQTGRTQSAG